MKERGVGVVGVIAIVIVIAAVVAGGYFLLKGEGEEPLYPGSESYYIPQEFIEAIVGEIPEGVEIFTYSVSDASVQQILNWYKAQMIGWTLEGEGEPTYDPSTGMTTGVLVYRKGDEGAGISAISGMPGAEGTVYILVTGPWSA